jgi:putative transposase
VQRAHGHHAEYLNTRRGCIGHLWQNQFYSCPLDKGHMWMASGYAERNPVRSSFVERAGEHRQSIAQAHLTVTNSRRLISISGKKPVAPIAGGNRRSAHNP